MTDKPLTCDKCGKPILDGQATYTVAYDEEAGTGRHWDCHKKTVDKFKESMKHMDESMMKRAEAIIKELNKRI